MGIKNSKQSVNISTIPKKDAKKCEVTEKGDTSKESDDDLKVELIKDPAGEASGEVANPNSNSENNLEPVKGYEESNGQVVPVLKVEDVEVITGVEKDPEEVAKPTMSKVASMKRDLSFGRLQKMFSREAKSETPQQQQEGDVKTAEIPATDEEELKTGEGKEEDIESRVTGLKRSLMKMFARESESEGATANETSAATEKEVVEDVKEGDDEKSEGEASPKKMSSLKKRLSFKAMRSKFSKEKKDASADNNDEEKEKDADKESNEKKIANEVKENDTKEGEAKEEITVAETMPALIGVKVNLHEDEVGAGTSSPTDADPEVPEELKQSGGADSEVEEKQPENVVQELLGSEKDQTELETSGTESSKGE